MPDKTNEIGAVGGLLLPLLLKRLVVTADVLLTQRAISQAIMAKRGDYLSAVKTNQAAPTLTLSPPLPPRPMLPGRSEARPP